MVFGQSNLAAVMLHLHVYELNSRFWRKLERLVVKVAAWKDKPVETVDQYDLREWVEFVNCRNLARKAAKTDDSRCFSSPSSETGFCGLANPVLRRPGWPKSWFESGSPLFHP